MFNRIYKKFIYTATESLQFTQLDIEEFREGFYVDIFNLFHVTLAT